MEDYKAILTYTISDEERSKQFTDFLEDLGCVKQEDQSTYGIPHFVAEAYQKINAFCKKNINSRDTVSLYKLHFKSINEGWSILKTRLPL